MGHKPDEFHCPWEQPNLSKKNNKNNWLAERSFDLQTSGLWAQHASTAPLCCLLIKNGFVVTPWIFCFWRNTTRATMTDRFRRVVCKLSSETERTRTLITTHREAAFLMWFAEIEECLSWWKALHPAKKICFLFKLSKPLRLICPHFTVKWDTLIYLKCYCQKWDSNPRPQKWTATWTQRLRPLGHPDMALSTIFLLTLPNIICCFLGLVSSCHRY